ncbi:DUF262 domain-containing protein [Flavisolibacter tropicus]|uniref:GmrSD restriction endonucleases N-terminal domain-containing protein n=1 Tax=Flavisolibacter tropicus TaxID=1492898 RepID=A0A172TXP4_9BACT|nr:DUF262 domain-containing protein [Flavisolibacter tropicus]ANE51507.1 hypothetical protein SY85_14345 [Flavisolibacter tropicus]
MKLKESIPSNSVKIIELYNKINSDILDTRPDFQRKLVWKKQHKYHFIQTILMNFPFPEVYIASAEMDVQSLTAKEIVVDGQQRLTTIVDYIKGENDFKEQNKVTPFDQLSVDQKKEFLNYLVTVKDLKDMSMVLIKEIFQRINNTEYSLNAVEKTNAQYGDGEFAIFCKQVVDKSYNPSLDDTDIILDAEVKRKLNSFFETNNVFTDNDKTRMFDTQYSMLIVSTLLEGSYYGRSTKVEDYLKRYNASFTQYTDALNLLTKSIDIISGLQLSSKSYWFNKANLFSLIIELSKVDPQDLNFEKLEANLLELENKNDTYFSEENLETITDDEKRYFEVARQGSNEKASRVHRGKVISSIINNSKKVKSTYSHNSIEEKRLAILSSENIKYVTIEPSKTSLKNYHMDATSIVREFLKVNQIHDYDSQGNGADHKVTKQATLITHDNTIISEASFYKANNRGDARIWFSNLGSFANETESVAIIVKNSELYLVNVSQLDIENLTGKTNPFNDIILS